MVLAALADRENLKAISPLFHADKITKPLMVLQGKNDPRVIKPESDEVVDAVKKKGGVVEYVVFDDEGHGFTKKANEHSALSFSALSTPALSTQHSALSTQLLSTQHSALSTQHSAPRPLTNLFVSAIDPLALRRHQD